MVNVKSITSLTPPNVASSSIPTAPTNLLSYQHVKRLLPPRGQAYLADRLQRSRASQSYFKHQGQIYLPARFTPVVIAR
jgi:hypothetical protein